MTIEGIPEGYELARIGAPKRNEPYLTPRGQINIAEGDFEGCGYAVLRKVKKETKVVEITRWITLCKSWVNGEYLLHLVVDKQHLAKDCPEPQLHTFRFEVEE